MYTTLGPIFNTCNSHTAPFVWIQIIFIIVYSSTNPIGCNYSLRIQFNCIAGNQITLAVLHVCYNNFIQLVQQCRTAVNQPTVD